MRRYFNLFTLGFHHLSLGWGASQADLGDKAGAIKCLGKVKTVHSRFPANSSPSMNTIGALANVSQLALYNHSAVRSLMRL